MENGCYGERKTSFDELSVKRTAAKNNKLVLENHGKPDKDINDPKGSPEADLDELRNRESPFHQPKDPEIDLVALTSDGVDISGTAMIGNTDFGSYDKADATLMISNADQDPTSLLLYNDAGAYHSGLVNYHNNIYHLQQKYSHLKK